MYRFGDSQRDYSACSMVTRCVEAWKSAGTIRWFEWTKIAWKCIEKRFVSWQQRSWAAHSHHSVAWNGMCAHRWPVGVREFDQAWEWHSTLSLCKDTHANWLAKNSKRTNKKQKRINCCSMQANVLSARMSQILTIMLFQIHYSLNESKANKKWTKSHVTVNSGCIYNMYSCVVCIRHKWPSGCLCLSVRPRITKPNEYSEGFLSMWFERISYSLVARLVHRATSK